MVIQASATGVPRVLYIWGVQGELGGFNCIYSVLSTYSIVGYARIQLNRLPLDVTSVGQ